jgi:hypothetical protein
MPLQNKEVQVFIMEPQRLAASNAKTFEYLATSRKDFSVSIIIDRSSTFSRKKSVSS